MRLERVTRVEWLGPFLHIFLLGGLPWVVFHVENPKLSFRGSSLAPGIARKLRCGYLDPIPSCMFGDKLSPTHPTSLHMVLFLFWTRARLRSGSLEHHTCSFSLLRQLLYDQSWWFRLQQHTIKISFRKNIE
jgi:hypothetical protein